jgi:hypothetical protein
LLVFIFWRLAHLHLHAGALINRFEHDLVSCSFSYDGSRLCSVGKDYKLRWFDPRVPIASMAGGVYAHSFVALRPQEAWNVSSAAVGVNNGDEFNQAGELWLTIGPNKMQQPTVGSIDARRADQNLLETALDGMPLLCHYCMPIISLSSVCAGSMCTHSQSRCAVTLCTQACRWA